MGAGHDHHHFFEMRASPWLEDMDPRARVVAFCAFAVCAATTTSLEGGAVGLWIALALVYWGGVPIVYVLYRLRFLGLVLLPIAVLLPFSGSDPIWPDLPLSPTRRGTALAGLIGLRATASATAAVVAVGVGPFERTIEALRGLHLPRSLVLLTSLTYRYLFMFREEVARVQTALSARGFVPTASRRTLHVLGEATGGILVRSLRRTERIDQAMRCRGFQGELRLRKRPRAQVRSAGALLVLALAAGLALGDRLGAPERPQPAAAPSVEAAP